MDRPDIPAIRCEKLHNGGGHPGRRRVTGGRLVRYDLGKDAGMDKLLPINDLQREDVLSVVRQSLRHGLNADALEDFLASVDWSGTDRERPEIADVLGQMEGWASQFGDGH